VPIPDSIQLILADLRKEGKYDQAQDAVDFWYNNCISQQEPDPAEMNEQLVAVGCSAVKLLVAMGIMEAATHLFVVTQTAPSNGAILHFVGMYMTEIAAGSVGT
jgi:hypothetical protein